MEDTTLLTRVSFSTWKHIRSERNFGIVKRHYKCRMVPKLKSNSTRILMYTSPLPSYTFPNSRILLLLGKRRSLTVCIYSSTVNVCIFRFIAVTGFSSGNKFVTVNLFVYFGFLFWSTSHSAWNVIFALWINAYRRSCKYEFTSSSLSILVLISVKVLYLHNLQVSSDTRVWSECRSVKQQWYQSIP